jgi:ubiquitin-conjugating enzyme E2 J2
MATPGYVIRLSRDFKAIQKSPIPYIQARPCPTNILSWSYIITGPPSTPYEGGQYYGHLTFPPTFPYAAPDITMITPSGRFEHGVNICTTFTSKHPQEWNPSWTVETILTGFLSFMTGEEIGGGIVRATDQQRRTIARQSKSYNSLKCRRFRTDFQEVHEMNFAEGKFTEDELKKCALVDEEDSTTVMTEATSTEVAQKLFDNSYESHKNEDWEKYGSMEEDEIDYDEEEYETSDTELDGVEKEA